MVHGYQNCFSSLEPQPSEMEIFISIYNLQYTFDSVLNLVSLSILADMISAERKRKTNMMITCPFLTSSTNLHIATFTIYLKERSFMVLGLQNGFSPLEPQPFKIKVFISIHNFPYTLVLVLKLFSLSIFPLPKKRSKCFQGIGGVAPWEGLWG